MFSWFKKRTSAQKKDIVESSMNFDTDGLKEFLPRISKLINLGFGDREVAKFMTMVQKMQLDEEKELSFNIHFEGQPSLFRVGVFMDDIDSPDVYFFSPPQLAEQISNKMQEFSEEKGI